MAARYSFDFTTVIKALGDQVCLVGAWIFAFYFRFHAGLPVPKGVPSWAMYLKLLPFISVIWFVVFVTTGHYRRLGSHRSPLIESWDIVRTCVIALLAFIAATYFYNEYKYSRSTLLLFTAVHPLALIFGRSMVRKGLRLYRRRTKPRSILMIGSDQSLEAAVGLVERGNLVLGRIAGVMAVGTDEQRAATAHYCQVHKLALLPLPEVWADFFAQQPCESVIMALPYNAYGFIDHHLEELANQVTDIKMIPDLMRFTRFKAGIDIVDHTPIVNIHDSPLQGIGRLYKRVLDVVGACCALLLFSPVMMAAAALVRLSSRGPILYRQERMGVDGRIFPIFKFRTMPITAEQSSGAVWANKDDGRATPIGQFLRRTSLDELPQLWNVLRGEMSLVGPRPERPVFVNQFRKNVPGYMLRHKVKAGMTGWAQVNGWRGNTSIEKRIEYDLFYIQNWSLWLDIKILFLTVFRGFINPNAY